MTFSDNYLKHLEVLQNVGMTRIDEVEFNGQKIVPIQFLKALLPDPGSLGQRYQGEDLHRRHRRGHQGRQAKAGLHLQHLRPRGCYEEVQSQAISYTTGVPAMVGAIMMLTGTWQGRRASATWNSSIPSRSWRPSASTVCHGKFWTD